MCGVHRWYLSDANCDGFITLLFIAVFFMSAFQAVCISLVVKQTKDDYANIPLQTEMNLRSYGLSMSYVTESTAI